MTLVSAVAGPSQMTAYTAEVDAEQGDSLSHHAIGYFLEQTNVILDHRGTQWSITVP